MILHLWHQSEILGHEQCNRALSLSQWTASAQGAALKGNFWCVFFAKAKVTLKRKKLSPIEDCLRKWELFHLVEVISHSWIFYSRLAWPKAHQHHLPLSHTHWSWTDTHTCPHTDCWTWTVSKDGHTRTIACWLGRKSSPHTHSQYAPRVNYAGLKGRGSGLIGDQHPGVPLQLSATAASPKYTHMQTHKNTPSHPPFSSPPLAPGLQL